MITRARDTHSWLTRSAGWMVAALIVLACGSAPAGAQECAGDCDDSNIVDISELIRGVNIALGKSPVGECKAFDQDDNGRVTINELVKAVDDALDRCSGTPASAMAVSGIVLGVEAGGAPPGALSGATVRGTVDRNRNEQIESGEEVRTTTDPDGKYRLDLTVRKGDTLVVAFEDDGKASLYRTIIAGPEADVVLNATLYAVEDLKCTGARCAVDGNALSIEGLPEDVSGSGAVFNPVTDPEAFPGDFRDDGGNLLLSGVFATVELIGGDGKAVRQLDQPVALRMRMPRDTWSIIQDITPGNGQIDVPLYAFEEILGTWVRDGQGVLEDGDGKVLGEGVLGDIRSGEYKGVVVARGAVQHFSYWNVDWPVEDHACITGVITDADGNPVEGATVMSRGVTYTGTSTPQTTGRDGRFCVDVMRSEGPGEDVDQDGIQGETQKVGFRVSYQGKVYDGGEYDIPKSQGSCGTGGCRDIGEIALSPDRELQAALCTVSGKVRGLDGEPVEGATVFGLDETIPDDVFTSLCFNPQHFCQFFAATDAEGAFTITTAVLDALFYFAVHSSEDDTSTLHRLSQGNVRGCPSQPLDIILSEGYRSVTLTAAVTEGGVISWTPEEYQANSLVVSGATDLKWVLGAASSSIATPVTYGTVPAGTEQTFPIDASPPPLSSGDTIQILLSGTGSDGYPYFGYGTVDVP